MTWAASILCRLGIAFFALVTVLPLFRVGTWWVRLCDFPRLQFVGLTTLFILGMLVSAWLSRWSRLDTVFSLLGLSVIAWQLSHFIPYTPLWKKQLPDVADNGNAGNVVRSVVVNLQYENDLKAEVREQLRKLDVDLLLLIEIDAAWSDALEPLKNDYPFRIGEVKEEGLGLVLWSKIPWEAASVEHLVTESRPSVFAKLKLGETQYLRYVGLHPTPPGLPQEHDDERFDSRIRDAELMLVAKKVADKKEEMWLVTGDFNDVAWSHTTRLFQRLSRLCDPRVGRGLYNTYHAENPFLRFPIDQVFASSQAAVREIRRFHPSGSDHFAIRTELLFPVQSADENRPSSSELSVRSESEAREPKPEGDDRKDARQLIQEGAEQADNN